MRAKLIESYDFYKDSGFSEEEIKNLKSSENPTMMKLSKIESYVINIKNECDKTFEEDFPDNGYEDPDDAEDFGYYEGMQNVAENILKIINL